MQVAPRAGELGQIPYFAQFKFCNAQVVKIFDSNLRYRFLKTQHLQYIVIILVILVIKIDFSITMLKMRL